MSATAKLTPPPPWQPGLDNEDQTLGEVLASMPRDQPASVPWYVRLLENPRSPVALAGAIDLLGHDCIHILLGRGITPPDEAFTIGFTMGASRQPRWQELLFRICSGHLYQGLYRFSAQDEAIFLVGAACGRWTAGRPLHTVDYRRRMQRSLGDLRRELGIRVDALRAAYALERLLWPRLEIDRGPSAATSR